MLPAGAKKAQGLEVRLATPSDSVAIAEVLREAFTAYREHYTAEAFNVVTPGPEIILGRFEEGPMWVAQMDVEVVGTVSLTTEPEGLYVRSMAVSPKAQGRGIGHLLLEAVDEYAKSTEFERIFLYTTYFVPGAKELYAKHGYEWVRDTTADEWYGTPGLEMDKRIERKTQNVIGSQRPARRHRREGNLEGPESSGAEGRGSRDHGAQRIGQIDVVESARGASDV